MRHVTGGFWPAERIVGSVSSHQFRYCRNYKRWVNRDYQAPFDQHMLVAAKKLNFVLARRPPMC